MVKVFSATMLGLKPVLVEVEVDHYAGCPNLLIIGLPNKAVNEAKERLIAALLNCQVRLRRRRIVINLAPADVRKTSSTLELAMAVALLKMQQLVNFATQKIMFFGELALNGEVKPIRGALPLVLAAKEMGFEQIVLPAANLAEIALVGQVKVLPIHHLKELLVASHQGHLPFMPLGPPLAAIDATYSGLADFQDIYGQTATKRALAIAAAGGHHLLMVGPPGAGKTMLAKALVSILPPLSNQELIEVNKIYSVAGLIDQELLTHRPFRLINQNISLAALLGGGSQLRPGEISLAHTGVLFLDEFSQFSNRTIEALRQPLQDQMMVINRTSGVVQYPCSFMLVAASNPCFCGYANSQQKACRCSAHDKYLYQQKFSGPMMDRLDLAVYVQAVQPQIIIQAAGADVSNGAGEIKTALKSEQGSAYWRAKVAQARTKQLTRYQNSGVVCNAHLTNQLVKKYCRLDQAAQQLLNHAVDNLSLSVRSYFKVVKVAQTIADLDDHQQINQACLAEALAYRRDQYHH